MWGEKVTEKLVWHVVKEFASKIGVSKLAPHDLRRSCARLCRAAGGELEQIQFLLGHVSVQTTERYLGCTQRIPSAVNDSIGIEPKTGTATCPKRSRRSNRRAARPVTRSALFSLGFCKLRMLLPYLLIPFDFTSQFEFVQRLQSLPTNILPASLSPFNVQRSQSDATLANSPPPG